MSHTKRRDSVEPTVEEIDGVGPSLSSRILSRFSGEELREADPEDLRQIDGIGPSLADRITEEFER
jgi:excinuclease ABC subunit C